MTLDVVFPPVKQPPRLPAIAFSDSGCGNHNRIAPPHVSQVIGSMVYGSAVKVFFSFLIRDL